MPIGELLVQSKVLTREQLEQALAFHREPGKKIGQLLIERGWVTEAQLTQTLSLQLSVPWVSLYHIDFSRQLLNRVTRDLAERHCLIPIFVRHVKGQGETLYVAMDDPTNEAALAEVSRLASLPARPMIASASDIRSAIRVYYGEPTTTTVLDVPMPPARAPEPPPVTTREGRRPEPPPVPHAAPAAPAAPAPPISAAPATEPDASPRGARPSRPPAQAARPSQPPPEGPRASPPPAQGHRPSQPPAGASTLPSQPPPRRSAPPDEAAPARRPSTPPGGPAPAPEAAVRRRPGKMVSLTLLDGTTISLPARPAGGPKTAFAPKEGLTARDFISALRAASHGADASEILGDKPQWEPVVAAVLSILLRKGLIADWELVEELRKI